jgi:tetratricopeptide (TPR) repeat protein
LFVAAIRTVKDAEKVATRGHAGVDFEIRSAQIGVPAMQFEPRRPRGSELRAAFLRRVVCAMVSALALAASALPANSDDRKPPLARMQTIQGDDATQVESLATKIDQLMSAVKFTEAIEPAKQLLKTCEKVLGPNHWKTQDARRAIETLKHVASLPEEGRKAMASVGSLIEQRKAAGRKRQYQEFERLSREILQIVQRWLGEAHPETARACDQLAGYLMRQGKLAEAESLDRKALSIRLETLGEAHPETASSFHNLAFILNEQGKYADAEPLHSKALSISIQTRGEDDPETATVYNIYGRNLETQGNYAAAEPMFRRAVAIRLKTLGERDSSTATSIYNLALVLLQQGKYADAEPFCRRALGIRLKLHGENHFLSANSYDALAADLDYQGKLAEAEGFYRSALAIKRKVLGENHSRTANEYDNLACNLTKQGKHSEADPLYRQALAIMVKAGAEDDPLTGNIYSNLANHLGYVGRLVEAEPLHRKALGISQKSYGKYHDETGARFRNLAFNLEAQGKLEEAVKHLTTASEIFEQVRRLYSSEGLQRSLNWDDSPQSALAVALARQGKRGEAWSSFETGLARGLLDDVSAKLLRPLTGVERRIERDLVRQVQALDERIARSAAKPHRTQVEDKDLEAMRDQQSLLRARWLEFQNGLDQTYQAYAGKPSTLDKVQGALAADAALVGWVDVGRHHWACVVRHSGEPAWVKIPGTGKDGTWTKEDDEVPSKVREALARGNLSWQPPAERLAHQRLIPLLPYLRNAKHVIALPARALAGVPIEVLIAAGSPPDARTLIVSYAPSGSLLARLKSPGSQATRPLRLLALGDPAFPPETKAGPAPNPPGHGIAIVDVVPHGNADLFGIIAGDVLLEYDGKTLQTSSDLVLVPKGDKAVHVPVKVWRHGEIRPVEVAAGPLGILSNAKQSAAQVVLARRAAEEVLAPGIRGVDLTALPGTRYEVQAIAALFPKDHATTLLGTDATESSLQRLARAGALKQFRLIHLATHGRADLAAAFRSSIFLAAEPDRPSSAIDPAALDSTPDGRITAEQIVRTWDLDADLVVLSACESGLGRYAGGEGYLGFAQALFAKGARSLVLSQWRVDDRATSLLMTRFYQNMLGKRPGLSKPMPKAEALREAKKWLRGLTTEEVAKAESNLPQVSRGEPRPLKGTPVSVHPYDHPHFWAAFVLVGDPD